MKVKLCYTFCYLLEVFFEFDVLKDKISSLQLSQDSNFRKALYKSLKSLLSPSQGLSSYLQHSFKMLFSDRNLASHFYMFSLLTNPNSQRYIWRSKDLLLSIYLHNSLKSCFNHLFLFKYQN